MVCEHYVAFAEPLMYLTSRNPPQVTPFWKLDPPKNLSRCVCQISGTSPQCSIQRRVTLFNAKYVQNGDLIIGGIFTVSFTKKSLHRKLNDILSFCEIPMPHFYRYLMAFIFAIDEINKNPDILPNVTLGYHVYDSCNSVNNAVYSVLQILSGPGDPIPNYFCKKFGNLVGIIGDLNPDISLTLAQILGVLGYSQTFFCKWMKSMVSRCLEFSYMYHPKTKKLY
ncbi:unnamed protein product [Ranitomeya imitator]|uniref:Receptor ligand binding region domain-containing protein n=1 Tax=Ranitomeya imitator TaxID=111125 RepID=A0ABN9MLZ4_9NEOB|nr:unnamed protein product [Ranitomeya imitator]